MKIEYDETLRIRAEVMETMAFMFCDPAEKDDLVSEDGVYFMAVIGFHGHCSGSVNLCIAEETCKEIACNILGIDELSEGDDSKASDALKEVLNVLCGQFLTAYAGEDALFDLTMPEVETITSEGWSDFKGSDGVFGFLLDESPVLLKLSFDEQQR